MGRAEISFGELGGDQGEDYEPYFILEFVLDHPGHWIFEPDEKKLDQLIEDVRTGTREQAVLNMADNQEDEAGAQWDSWNSCSSKIEEKPGLAQRTFTPTSRYFDPRESPRINP